MKTSISFKTVLISVLIVLSSFNGYAQSYPRVIFEGDYPDPTIMRDGKDYYMTHSTFEYYPGLLIWHSTDLVNWTPITRALTKHTGSVFAPELIKHNGRFYIYYPANGTNYVIWADRIEGPWSEPYDLKVTGIDPGHITDRDGTRYLFLNNGEVVQLSEDGLQTIGDKKKVYDGWIYPGEWKTEGKDMYLESPKLIYKDGYYYMASAEGGTAGPATSHMIVLARSKSIFGPWENSPYNPLVHTYSDS